MKKAFLLNVSTGAKEKGITAGIAVGAVIALEARFAGPICGASMNPARSFAPAIISGHLEHLWLYLIAPPLGACAATLACRCICEQGCCTQRQPDIQAVAPLRAKRTPKSKEPARRRTKAGSMCVLWVP